jgi:GNAT superfamily N-acetyltransferase
MSDIENIELKFLSIDDYEELKEVMIQAYKSLDNAFWKKQQIKKLISIFPEGQVVIKVNGHVAGAALSIVVDYDQFEEGHTYREITADYTFKTHDPNGDRLYGIDVVIKPEFRGLRLGRRLYDYRKELCEKLNLKGIAFGGRIPNYHLYSKELTPRDYIRKVRHKEIHDPVLNFQLSNDFHVAKLLKGYLDGDEDSGEYAALLEWDNIYYEKPSKNTTQTKKTIVRLGLIQWQMRSYRNLDELMQQAEFFVDAVSGYRADFALFPEFFNAPLMKTITFLSPKPFENWQNIQRL